MQKFIIFSQNYSTHKGLNLCGPVLRVASNILLKIGSGNGLSIVCRQAFSWINGDFLSNKPIGTVKLD